MTVAVESKKHMSDLHFQHNVWANALKFYTEELVIFTKRLEEVTSRNTDREFLANVEHFQNIFIRQKEVIDILLHDINQHESELVKYAKDHPIAVDHVYFQNHTSLVDRIETFEKIWKELREEYMRFLAKWM